MVEYIDTGSPTQTPEEMMGKINAWIEQMEGRTQQLQPVLQGMLDDIYALIQQAQKNRTTPMGTPFLPLSPTTSQLYSKGIGRPSTGRLASSFTGNITNNNISLNNSLPYANTQMFGNPNNKVFGKGIQVHPIPARPYLDINGTTIEFPIAMLERWDLKIGSYIVNGDSNA